MAINFGTEKKRYLNINTKDTETLRNYGKFFFFFFFFLDLKCQKIKILTFLNFTRKKYFIKINRRKKILYNKYTNHKTSQKAE